MGGGGLGDWDGCHYLPGSIGETLRELQEDVVDDFVAGSADESGGGGDVVMGPWWRNDQPLLYSPTNGGAGGERGAPATRFCTVGSLPPWMVAYTATNDNDNDNNSDSVLWNAPFAGICVPSSCTARSLYQLFAVNSVVTEIETEDGGVSGSNNGEESFVEELLNLTLSNLMMAESNSTLLSSSLSSKREDTISIAQASKRYNYISSLAQSIGAARQFQSGVLCEGETGSAVVDQGFRDWGYYGTIGLLVALMGCVFLGTISSSWSKRGDSHTSRKMMMLDDDDDDDDDGCVGGGNGQYYNTSHGSHLHNKGDHNGGECTSFSKLTAKLDYGSNGNANNGDDNEQQKRTICYKIPLFTTNWNTIKTTATVEIVSQQLKPSSSSSSRHQEYFFGHGKFCLMKSIHDLFGYFDAGQSFYEITRMTRRSDSSITSGSDVTKKRAKSSYSSELVRTNDNDDDKEEGTASVSSSHCMNGLRSISMLWIILAHTVVCHSSIGYTNPAAVFPPTGVMASRFGSFILSARYAVDTFFFIGGYLVMSGLLKKLDSALIQEEEEEDRGSSGGDLTKMTTVDEKVTAALWVERLYRWGILSRHHVVNGEYSRHLFIAKKNKISNKQSKGLRWMFPFLLHRIMRILPTYGVVLLLWWKVAITLADSPFWPQWVSFTEKCDEHAWTNMLFVNNLVPWYQPLAERDECMFHAWYLGVDFQLCAVLTPIFVSLYLRKGYRKLTIQLECLALIGIIVTSMFCSYEFGWSAYVMDGQDSAAFDRGFYTNPFFRASPYIIGFITAQLWHEKRRLVPDLGLTNRMSSVASLIAIGLMLWLSFTGREGYQKRPCLNYESSINGIDCGSGLSSMQIAIYTSLMRPAWGFGLALLSLLSFNGQLQSLGSSSLLNWSGWNPIGKLSFSMYLIHPIVGNILILGRTNKIRYSHVDLLTDFVGIATVTFFMALAIGMLVEWPISRITHDLERKLWTSNSELLSPSKTNANS